MAAACCVVATALAALSRGHWLYAFPPLPLHRAVCSRDLHSSEAGHGRRGGQRRWVKGELGMRVDCREPEVSRSGRHVVSRAHKDAQFRRLGANWFSQQRRHPFIVLEQWLGCLAKVADIDNRSCRCSNNGFRQQVRRSCRGGGLLLKAESVEGSKLQGTEMHLRCLPFVPTYC
jgi:hypothetical protein